MNAVAAREAEAGQRRAAEDERAVARAVNDFWLHDVLRQADSPEQADRGFTADPTLSVKEALNRATDRIGDRFRDQPLVEAAARQAIGEAFVGIGEYPRALPQAQRALALRAERLGPDHLLTLASTDGLGTAYLYLDRPADALGLLEAAVKARREGPRPRHLDTLDSVVALGICYRMLGRTAEAVALQEDGAPAGPEHLGLDHPITIRSLNNLASHYRFAGRVPSDRPAGRGPEAPTGPGGAPAAPGHAGDHGPARDGVRGRRPVPAAVALFEETLRHEGAPEPRPPAHADDHDGPGPGATAGPAGWPRPWPPRRRPSSGWQTRRGPRDPFLLTQVSLLADLHTEGAARPGRAPAPPVPGGPRAGLGRRVGGVRGPVAPRWGARATRSTRTPSRCCWRATRG